MVLERCRDGAFSGDVKEKADPGTVKRHTPNISFFKVNQPQFSFGGKHPKNRKERKDKNCT